MNLLKYKDSEWEYTYYLDSNGNQVLHGKHTFWYTSGHLLQHCFYVNGKLHGEFKSWYDNGQLRTHCFYVDGYLHGECKSWRSTGELCHHCFYVDGEEIPVVDFKSEEEQLLFQIQHPDFRFIED